MNNLNSKAKFGEHAIRPCGYCNANILRIRCQQHTLDCYLQELEKKALLHARIPRIAHIPNTQIVRAYVIFDISIIR